MPTKLSLAARLDNLTRVDDNGCHIFIGGMNSARPYPLISSEENGRKPLLAYRAAWELVNGPIAELQPPAHGRWELHHTCEIKTCCNPDHLELISSRDHRRLHNVMRCLSRKISSIAPYGYIPASFAAVAA